MSQMGSSDAEHADKRKKTGRERPLAKMELVVPWKALLKVIELALSNPATDMACHGYRMLRTEEWVA